MTDDSSTIKNAFWYEHTTICRYNFDFIDPEKDFVFISKKIVINFFANSK